MMHTDVESPQAAYVARQPILDQTRRVFGYELLYRATAAETSCTASGDTAGARLLTDAILNLGLDTLTGGRPAFLNLTRSLLTSGIATVVNPSKVVFELLEDIPVDADVIDACRRLHNMGYALALDDFVPDSDAEWLLPYAKYVKVDVLATSPDTRIALAERLRSRGVRLVAEKVETAEVFHEARQEGFSLFQGYFFYRPTTFGTGAISAGRLSQLRLMSALQRPDLSIVELEELIKPDAALTYRVLRSVSSAAYGLHHEVHSIREALLWLGIDQIRKWASVWALAGLDNTGASELVTMAVIRARCCERLGGHGTATEAGSELFLLGLCSLLDAILNRPMSVAVANLPLPADTRRALLGEQNWQRSVLDAVVNYERGHFEDATERARTLGLPDSALPTAFGEALRWARQLGSRAEDLKGDTAD